MEGNPSLENQGNFTPLGDRKIVLGLDMDGVLYDWHDAVYTYYQSLKGYEGAYYEFWTEKIKTFSPEDWDYLVSLPFLYTCKIPTDRIMNFLDYCASRAEIYYITNRPDSVSRITKNYIKNSGFPYPDNVFITDRKDTICRYAGITHFLDDLEKNILAVENLTNAFLLARVYNQTYRDKYKTVYGLNEFKEAVFNEGRNSR